MGLDWVHQVSGDELPSNAIKAGHEASGEPFYVAQAEIGAGEGSHPAKFGETSGRGALVAYGGEERYVPKYAILTGDESEIRWVDRSGVPTFTGFRPIVVGQTGSGQSLYFVQTDYEGGVYPGKVFEGAQGAIIAYAGKEIQGIQNYRVLAYARGGDDTF